MTITELLKSASQAESAETATFLASILNTDLYAIRSFTNRNTFMPDDVLRIGRVVEQYAAMASRSGVSDFKPIRAAVGEAKGA